MGWAQRLKRVFGIEIDTCQRCGGTLMGSPGSRSGRARAAPAEGLGSTHGPSRE
jgi:hypothetical protein